MRPFLSYQSKIIMGREKICGGNGQKRDIAKSYPTFRKDIFNIEISHYLSKLGISTEEEHYNNYTFYHSCVVILSMQ